MSQANNIWSTRHISLWSFGKFQMLWTKPVYTIWNPAEWIWMTMYFRLHWGCQLSRCLVRAVGSQHVLGAFTPRTVHLWSTKMYVNARYKQGLSQIQLEICNVVGNIKELLSMDSSLPWWYPLSNSVQPSDKHVRCRGEIVKGKYHHLYDSLMSETTVAEPELAGWKRASDHCTQSFLCLSTYCHLGINVEKI